MDLFKLIIQIAVVFLGSLSLLMSILLFLRLQWPAPFLWFLKLVASAMSPLFALIGAICVMAGFITGSVFISLMGVYIASIFVVHIYRVTRPPGFSGDFKKAFGSDWESLISPELKKHFLPKRSTIKLPAVANIRLEQNIVFSTIPGSDRHLLCDIWRPHENVIPSGLAFIYMHGSAWCLLDKDLGTRPFFSHLTAQGHVITDLAYRLAPETDMMGMVNDVKRAIVWMKENAGSFGVMPDRIVVGGGSAGGHLALMAAYTVNNLHFSPKELEGKDTRVSAVISLYGPTDLKAMYYHTNQHLTTRSIPGKPEKKATARMPGWVVQRMGENYHRLGMDRIFENAGTFVNLFGGDPDQCPEPYALFSPVNHVHADCPPTLLINGEHDLMASVKAARFLHSRLVQEKILSVMHILPQTDHAFDLIFPKISPSAHNAIYDVERFLGLLLRKTESNEKMAG